MRISDTSVAVNGPNMIPTSPLIEYHPRSWTWSEARKFLFPHITRYLLTSNSPLGAAVTTSPPNGYDNGELAVYFKQNASSNVRTPSRVIPSDKGESSGLKLAPGAIAGIAIGGAILIASIIVGTCFCLRRRNQNRIPLGSPRPSPQPITKALPQVPKEHFSPQSHYSHPYRQKPHGSHYQLPTTPEPVELYGSHYRMTGDYSKGEEANAGSPHPGYQHSRSPPPEPTATSPNPSTFSGRMNSLSKTEHYGSPTSIAPTFTTIGRSSRPPEQYYKP